MVYYLNLADPSSGLHTDAPLKIATGPLSKRKRGKKQKKTEPAIVVPGTMESGTHRDQHGNLRLFSKSARNKLKAAHAKPAVHKAKPGKVHKKHKVELHKHHLQKHFGQSKMAAEQIFVNLFSKNYSINVPQALKVHESSVLVGHELLTHHQYTNIQVVFKTMKDPSTGDAKLGADGKAIMEKVAREVISNRVPMEELITCGINIFIKVYAILEQLLLEQGYKAKMYKALKEALLKIPTVKQGKLGPALPELAKDAPRDPNKTAWKNYTDLYENYFKEQFRKSCGQIITKGNIVDFDDALNQKQIAENTTTAGTHWSGHDVDTYFQLYSKNLLSDLQFEVSRSQLELQAFYTVVQGWQGSDSEQRMLKPIIHGSTYPEISGNLHKIYEKCKQSYTNRSEHEIQEVEVKALAFEHAVLEYFSLLYANFCNAIGRSLYVFCAELGLHEHSTHILNAFNTGCMRTANEYRVEETEFQHIIEVLDAVHRIISDDNFHDNLQSGLEKWLLSDYTSDKNASDINSVKRKTVEVLFDNRKRTIAVEYIQRKLKVELQKKMSGAKMEIVEQMIQQKSSTTHHYSKNIEHSHKSLILQIGNFINMRKYFYEYSLKSSGLTTFETVKHGVRYGHEFSKMVKQTCFSLPTKLFWKKYDQHEQLILAHFLGHIHLPFSMQKFSTSVGNFGAILNAMDDKVIQMEQDSGDVQMDGDDGTNKMVQENDITDVNTMISYNDEQKLKTLADDNQSTQIASCERIKQTFYRVQCDQLRDLIRITKKLLKSHVTNKTVNQGYLFYFLMDALRGEVFSNYCKNEAMFEITKDGAGNVIGTKVRYHSSFSRDSYTYNVNPGPPVAQNSQGLTYQGKLSAAGWEVDFAQAHSFADVSTWKLSENQVIHLPYAFYIRYGILTNTGIWKKYVQSVRNADRDIHPDWKKLREKRLDAIPDDELPDKSDVNDACASAKTTFHKQESSRIRKKKAAKG
jgi:hypothetical protein